MRILQICSASDIGGGERYLADLSNSLTRHGHDIFFALKPEANLRKELDEISDENIHLTGMKNALDFRSAKAIADFARQKNVEIIHAHLGRDYFLASMVSRFSKTPFVLTRHVLFPLNRLHKIALRNVSGVIAPSNAVTEALKKQNIFPLEKIIPINYGINLEHFTVTQKKQDRTFTVGTIGHLSPIKGHDTFIRAAKIVLQQRPDIRFVIVGEDKSKNGENRRAIEKLISDLQLETKVELAGWTDDIRPFLRSIDIFVSAAREEAFGLVMIEAMLCGLPVIATRSEGAQQIIEDGISGNLIPIGDSEMLAQKILTLHENKMLREQFGANGQKRVAENFSLEQMVQKTEEFYRNVLLKLA